MQGVGNIQPANFLVLPVRGLSLLSTSPDLRDEKANGTDRSAQSSSVTSSPSAQASSTPPAGKNLCELQVPPSGASPPSAASSSRTSSVYRTPPHHVPADKKEPRGALTCSPSVYTRGLALPKTQNTHQRRCNCSRCVHTAPPSQPAWQTCRCAKEQHGRVSRGWGGPLGCHPPSPVL